MKAKSSRLYYGWVIVASFFVFNIVGQASGTLNFGFFVIPMAEELGLSRQGIGWAQTMRLWASGFSGILIGRWLDRHGPRGPMLLAIVVTTSGLLLLSRAQSPIVLLGVLLGLGITGWTAPAGGALIATVPVSKWFIRLRGRAVGIVQLGLGIGAALLVPISQALISNRGWRSAWVTLSWLSALALPLVFLMRRQPSDMGLNPDGETAISDQKNWNTKLSASSRSSPWTLGGSLAIMAFLLGAASVHRIPHWIELGFHPSTVSLAVSLDAVGATIMALTAGFVVERLDARIVGTASCISFCFAVALMAVGQAWTPLLFGSTFLFGIGVGLYMVVGGVIWAQYYGWQFVGTIRGTILPFTFLAGVLGAPLSGAMRDASGNYQSSWLLILALCVAATILIVSARSPNTSLDNQRENS